jgi:hypothetical protein
MYYIFQRLRRIDRKHIYPRRFLKALWRRIINVPHLIAFYYPFGFARNNRQKIRSFQNIHAGKRCFVVANGPSLKDIDFSLLKDEITIGMNRIYLMKEQNGFVPSYIVSIDKSNQLRQFAEEYNNLTDICFFEWNLRHLFSKRENFVFIKSRFSPKFSNDPSLIPFGSGQSVLYTCLQLAYYMGFKDVIIIGKDHSYTGTGRPGSKNLSSGNESNHFIKGYYKAGQNWGSPDYKSEEFAYEIADHFFLKNGCLIRDATINGNLFVFRKVDFYTLFSSNKSI